jgi:hypothetical protein
MNWSRVLVLGVGGGQVPSISQWRRYPMLFAIGALLFAASIQAQGVPQIRAVYQEVQAAIALCNETPGEPCGWFVNTLLFNKQSQPWPVVGILESEQDFWYNDDAEGDKYHLRKVNIKTSRSNRTENEEYLWGENGELLFYFFQLSTPDEPSAQEFRFYFAKGKLVDYAEKVSEAEKDYQQWKKDDAGLVQKAAEKLNELFLRTL